jgi:AcrR family transcriptional regulator
MDEGRGGTRRYRSDLRQRQAAETRLRVVQAAVTLFGRHGYRATTFAQLAETAGVSVKTVQEHGPKSALLQAAVELASFGVEGETDFFATDLGRAMLEVRDADGLAAMIGDAMVAINSSSAGLWMTVLGAAQGDAELSRYHARMLGLIRGQVEHVLRYVDDRGWLRRDVPFDDLVEAFCVVTCVETYVRFVRHDGRSEDRYRSFVARTIRETVLASR